jgi:fatty acid CoA ligase FadD22
VRPLRPIGPRFLGELDALGLGELLGRVAERHGDVTVTVDRPLDLAASLGQQLDYRTIATIVEETHARLHASGVREGDRVMIVRRNSLDTVILACAAARAGAIPALISSSVSADAAKEILARLGDATVISDTQTLAAVGLSPAAGPIDRLLTLGDTGSPDDLLSHTAGATPPARSRDPEAPLLITHTSGTTGIPKLVMHCARSLMAQVKPQLLLGAPFTRDGDRVAVGLAWSHIRALVCFAGVAMRGLELLALADFDSGAAAAPLAAFRPTLIETHPNAYVDWERLAQHPDAPLAAVKVYFSTFDSAHPSTIRRLLGASQRRVAFWLQVYGQSEIGPATMRIYPKGTPLGSARVVGWPLPGFTRVRVVDPATGRRVRRGKPGMIQVATRGRAITYVGQQDLARQQSHGIWWSTGDTGALNATRTLRFLDRKVDAIAGVESTIALEDTLLERLAQAREVVVIPTPAGEPLAVVCTHNDQPLGPGAWGAATNDLPALAGPLLLPFAELPMTGTLKVRRLELRERLARRGL